MDNTPRYIVKFDNVFVLLAMPLKDGTVRIHLTAKEKCAQHFAKRDWAMQVAEIGLQKGFAGYEVREVNE